MVFGRRKKRANATPLPERIEALQAAVDRGVGRLSDESLAFGQHVVEKANGRLRHGTEHTLVAMLGATGAGKSSLTNAIVGSDVATTGVRRPTTSSTMACVWGPDDATSLLEWLGVATRHAVTTADDDRLDGLVLLDVPDHDSVAVAHRLEMERIAEHADLMVWVTDPEKYADAALHRYLAQLASHGAVIVMVLNKVDTLSADDRDACTADLARLLELDGIDLSESSGSRVIPVSAATGVGIGDLHAVLADAVVAQEAVVQRLEADIALAATEMLGEAGGDGASTVDDRQRRRLADDLAGAAGVAAVTDAVARGHRRDAKAATGWPFTRWVAKLRPHPLRKLHLGEGSGGRTSLPAPTGAQRARADAAIRNIADATSAGMPSPWPAIVRKAATPPDGLLDDRLDQAVAGAVRDHRTGSPRWWSVVGALQFGLAIATIVGGLWLAGLAVAAWLQLPTIPTPSIRSIPIPTGLLILGALLGWIIALLSRWLASIGAKRAARRAHKQAADAVVGVADDLVIGPIEAELANRHDLVERLRLAGAAPPG